MAGRRRVRGRVEEEQLDGAAGRLLAADAGGDDAGVVDDEDGVRGDVLGEIDDAGVGGAARRAGRDDEQSRGIATLGGRLGDLRRGKVEVVVGAPVHGGGEVAQNAGGRQRAVTGRAGGRDGCVA
jgi:hypothetical protein